MPQAWGLPPAPPFPRVAQGDLLEPHAVMPGRPRDMQMSVDHCGGIESDVPVGGALGAASLRELRVPQHLRRLADQRKMVHQDDRQLGIAGLEPPLGQLDAGPAPVLPADVPVG